VEVGEVHALELGIKFGRADVLEELEIGPESTDGGAFGVVELCFVFVFGGGVTLLFGVHELGVGLVVPPHVAEVGIEDVCAGMDVADDAGAGGHGADELVFDGVPGGGVDLTDFYFAYGEFAFGGKGDGTRRRIGGRSPPYGGGCGVVV